MKVRFLPDKTAPEKNTYAYLFEYALATREFLEQHAWSNETAYQDIVLSSHDTASRGQCGVSSLWLARSLAKQGFNSMFTEGKIHIPNNKGNDHVWVEVRDAIEEPLVIDITSDQYQTVWGSPVHVGVYAEYNEVVGRYTPEQYFQPDNIPRKKLLGRYALLEAEIDRLPRRHRFPKT